MDKKQLLGEVNNSLQNSTITFKLFVLIGKNKPYFVNSKDNDLKALSNDIRAIYEEVHKNNDMLNAFKNVEMNLSNIYTYLIESEVMEQDNYIQTQQQIQDNYIIEGL